MMESLGEGVLTSAVQTGGTAFSALESAFTYQRTDVAHRDLLDAKVFGSLEQGGVVPAGEERRRHQHRLRQSAAQPDGQRVDFIEESHIQLAALA